MYKKYSYKSRYQAFKFGLLTPRCHVCHIEAKTRGKKSHDSVNLSLKYNVVYSYICSLNLPIIFGKISNPAGPPLYYYPFLWEGCMAGAWGGQPLFFIGLQI